MAFPHLRAEKQHSASLCFCGCIVKWYEEFTVHHWILWWKQSALHHQRKCLLGENPSKEFQMIPFKYNDRVPCRCWWVTHKYIFFPLSLFLPYFFFLCDSLPPCLQDRAQKGRTVKGVTSCSHTVSVLQSPLSTLITYINVSKKKAALRVLLHRERQSDRVCV